MKQDLFALDETYSTTRLITLQKPVIENNPGDKFKTMLFLPETEDRKGEGGLRTQGYFKKSLLGKPLITVITVVFNGEKYLEETIQSVINQTYDNVEYIIIDGASTDGTLDIIKKYAGQIDYWVSEPDGGIYAAMNKGIDVATGEWINFMNAGDHFYVDMTIKNIFMVNKRKYDLLYGDCEVLYDGFSRSQKSVLLDRLWKRIIFSHQSMFIKADIQKRNQYNILNQIGADFELIFKLKDNGNIFCYINEKVSIVRAEGLSDTKRFGSIKSNWKTEKRYNSRLFVDIYYSYAILDSLLRMISKRVLPKWMTEKIIKLK